MHVNYINVISYILSALNIVYTPRIRIFHFKKKVLRNSNFSQHLVPDGKIEILHIFGGLFAVSRTFFPFCWQIVCLFCHESLCTVMSGRVRSWGLCCSQNESMDYLLLKAPFKLGERTFEDFKQKEHIYLLLMKCLRVWG